MRALALALLAAPAAAQGVPAVEALLDRALAEQRVVLTCTSLALDTHALVREAWTRTVARTAAALRDGGYDGPAVERFLERAAYAALMPAEGATFAEVTALCHADPDWFRRFQNFDYAVLPGDLDDLLAE